MPHIRTIPTFLKGMPANSADGNSAQTLDPQPSTQPPGHPNTSPTVRRPHRPSPITMPINTGSSKPRQPTNGHSRQQRVEVARLHSFLSHSCHVADSDVATERRTTTETPTIMRVYGRRAPFTPSPLSLTPPPSLTPPSHPHSPLPPSITPLHHSSLPPPSPSLPLHNHIRLVQHLLYLVM